jgi:hypothetical protein
VEFGVWKGGTFISTVEIFNRFNETSIESYAIDIIQHGDLIQNYCEDNTNAHYFIWNESEIRDKTIELLVKLNEKYKNILLLIDGNHDYEYVKEDYDRLAPYVKYVAMHDIVNCAVPGVGQKWNEIKKSESFDFIYEFIYQYPDFQIQPFFGMGLLSRRDNDIEIFVLSHDQNILDSTPDLPYFKKINLNDLELGELQNNQLAEFRIYLGINEADLDDHEYYGFMTARWNEKYNHKINKLETLNFLNMTSNVIWCSHIENANWQSWINQFDGEEIIIELEKFNNMTRQPSTPFVWSGNYICHKDVAKKIVKFMNLNINYIFNEYGMNVPFIHPDPVERKRNFGFLLESILIMYLQNQKDLIFIEIK